MSSHISDEPDLPSAGRPANTPTAPPEPPPAVDPSTLPDYAEFQAWKARQTEASKPSEASIDVEELVLEIPDGDTVHRFTTVDITDDNVVAHLQVLVTFADNDMDRAGALFEALLGPIEYDRLRRTIRPMMRRIGAAYFDDPENNPSIQDVWIGMARTIAEPIKKLQSDPKYAGSQPGRSATGPTSSIASEPTSALPPSS